ncbi:MAG: CPBP family intramembrane metalloprotease [Sedimentisphaerales bacterium]|nr:CPBP family intramembrane metalloprotease [Sedimentisphaerales bacterium]
MRRQCGQSGGPNSLSFSEPARLFPDSQTRRPVWLTVETIAVTIAALAIIKMLNIQGGSNLRWFVIPGVLVAAALVPTWLGGRAFPPIGLDLEHAGLALGFVCRAFIYVLPMIFLALWLMKRLGAPIPLRPIIGRQHDWLAWLLYQFLYVAVAEEMFFRGYVQANVTKVLNCSRWRSSKAEQGTVIVVSAACFALAHVMVQGRMTSLVTFLPGALLAWLFVRTRSLLAPILFHGLANVTYGIMAMTLA